MREISLNILDIAQNSISANAKTVEISIICKSNELEVSVKDDGKGMSPELLSSVIDPFTTTRTTRKVGMGIPLFKEAAEATGGRFGIKSVLGKGTVTTAVFILDSIDRMPLGDLGETLSLMIMTSPQTDFRLQYAVEEREFAFDTREIKEAIEGLPIESPEIVAYMKELINENINEANGGLTI